MYKAANFRNIRKIRSIPLSTLVVNIKQKKDEQLRGEALEILAIRICQLLDLTFFGWRETDEELVAGGEVDGFMHTARLVYYHYNPARLPTPAEWVTVRRMRVKDAVNNVWWFVKEPFVDADNRRVLREYSDAMRTLLKNGYKAKMRPSGHDISTKFNIDHGGAIPSNLLQFANTESNSYYLKECRRAGIKPHPARFPRGLPDFFVRFLTRPGELVIDPFAGSNVTGESSHLLGRRWIGIEINEEYVRGSRFRFDRPDADVPASLPLFKEPPNRGQLRAEG